MFAVANAELYFASDILTMTTPNAVYDDNCEETRAARPWARECNSTSTSTTATAAASCCAFHLNLFPTTADSGLHFAVVAASVDDN